MTTTPLASLAADALVAAAGDDAATAEAALVASAVLSEDASAFFDVSCTAVRAAGAVAVAGSTAGDSAAFRKPGCVCSYANVVPPAMASRMASHDHLRLERRRRTAGLRTTASAAGAAEAADAVVGDGGDSSDSGVGSLTRLGSTLPCGAALDAAAAGAVGEVDACLLGKRMADVIVLALTVALTGTVDGR
ncbi:hypothetical protein WK60_05465 [Burkholderia ubonensis]|nr:hypothetical protein WK60_05465 [Burkholderia ubonensis]